MVKADKVPRRKGAVLGAGVAVGENGALVWGESSGPPGWNARNGPGVDVKCASPPTPTPLRPAPRRQSRAVRTCRRRTRRLTDAGRSGPARLSQRAAERNPMVRSAWSCFRVQVRSGVARRVSIPRDTRDFTAGSALPQLGRAGLGQSCSNRRTMARWRKGRASRLPACRGDDVDGWILVLIDGSKRPPGTPARPLAAEVVLHQVDHRAPEVAGGTLPVGEVAESTGDLDEGLMGDVLSEHRVPREQNASRTASEHGARRDRARFPDPATQRSPIDT